MRLLAALAAAVLLVACGDDGEEAGVDLPPATARPPDRAPDTEGSVSEVTAGSLRVDEATGVVGPLAARVDDATEVLRRRDGAYHEAALADIAVGDRVQVWVDGPVAESSPAQAHAEAVVLLP